MDEDLQKAREEIHEALLARSDKQKFNHIRYAIDYILDYLVKEGKANAST